METDPHGHNPTLVFEKTNSSTNNAREKSTIDFMNRKNFSQAKTKAVNLSNLGDTVGQKQFNHRSMEPIRKQVNKKNNLKKNENKDNFDFSNEIPH